MALCQIWQLPDILCLERKMDFVVMLYQNQSSFCCVLIEISHKNWVLKKRCKNVTSQEIARLTLGISVGLLVYS